MRVDIRTKSGKVFRNVDVLTVTDADDATKIHKFVYSETVENIHLSKAEEEVAETEVAETEVAEVAEKEAAEKKTSKRGKKNGS